MPLAFVACCHPINHKSTHQLTLQVITVPEECGTADALRHVAPQLTAPSVIVYSGDTVTDMHLPALLLEHQVGVWVCGWGLWMGF